MLSKINRSTLMYFSTQIIEQIGALARDLTPISDIASLLDINEDLLRQAIADKHNAEVRNAYYKNKALTSLQLRKQELELAKVGSPLAVQQSIGYIRDMNTNEDL